MKKTTLTLTACGLLSGLAFAGDSYYSSTGTDSSEARQRLASARVELASAKAALTSAKGAYVPAVPYAPAAAVATTVSNDWFVGGTGGYLLDAEDPMYTAHIGRDLGTWGSWNVASYLEAGYAEIDQTHTNYTGNYGNLMGNSFTNEFQMIPITLNLKLERAFTDSLRAYVGAGAGVALVHGDYMSSTTNATQFNTFDHDYAIYGQVFAGLLYHVSSAFEIYLGGRWIYLEGNDATAGEDFDDILVELGARYNF